MTFEIALRRFLLSPSFIQQGDGKPRPSKPKGIFSHTVGSENASHFPVGQTPSGQGDHNPKASGKYDERGRRKLWTIPSGEVQDAFTLYEKQLISTDDGAMIKKNSFYTIPLLKHSGGPPFLFGRVNVSMPMDGHIEDVQEVELSFPRAVGEPDRVAVEPHNVDLETPVKSYRIRVKMYGTDDDQADFARYESAFAEAGFAFDPGNDLMELLDSPDKDNEELPWFQLIGSSWFASFSPELQSEIRTSLWKLSAKATLLINYHPRHALVDVHTLNDELDYVYGLGDYYLSDPRTPEQTLRIIRKKFSKVFMDPTSRADHLSNRQKTNE